MQSLKRVAIARCSSGSISGNIDESRLCQPDVNMILFWLLTLSVLCVKIATNQWVLPKWGIVVTSTKTVLIPDGIVLRLNDSALVETFRLVRRRPTNR